MTSEPLIDQRPRWRAMLAGVTVLALGLRLWHLGWGLPYLFEEATPLFRAWEFWNWGGQGPDLNPRFFNYPALSFLVQYAVQAVHYGAGSVAGVYHEIGEFQAAWGSDFSRFVIMGRLPGVFFDVGTVMLVGVLARRLIGQRAGVIAALMAAVNPLQIRLSQMIVVDSMLTFFCSLAILVMLGLAQSGGTRRALLAGLLVGLAASTKYTGALLIVPLVVATVMGLHTDRPRSAAAAATAVIAPVMISVGVFLAVNPYVLIDTAAFLRDFGFEQAHMAAGHFGVPPGDSTPLFYLAEALPGALGWPTLVLSVPGIVWAIRHGDRRWAIGLLGFGALLLLPMFWAMRAERYVMPALPGLMLLFAAGMEWFRTLEWFRPLRGDDRRWTGHGASGLDANGEKTGRSRAIRPLLRPVSVILLLASYVQPLSATAGYHRSLFEPDTRAGASAWIKRNLPPGSAIVLTPAGVNVDSTYIQLPIPFVAVGLQGLAAFYDARWYADMDLLVGSDFDRARYLQEPERFGEFMRYFYDSLEVKWRTVWSAEPGPTCQGPRIWLFAPPGERARVPYSSDLIARLEKVTVPKSLAVFASNLASVLDARGRGDRARQLRVAAVDVLLRRFPREASDTIALLAAMETHPGEVRAIADSLVRNR